MINVDQLVTAARRLPQDGLNHSRLYTDSAGHHCLAAAVLIELGLGDAVPKWGDRMNGEPIHRFPHIIAHFGLDAARLLSLMQGEADDMRFWGIAIDRALDLNNG